MRVVFRMGNILLGVIEGVEEASVALGGVCEAAIVARGNLVKDFLVYVMPFYRRFWCFAGRFSWVLVPDTGIE